MRLALGDSKYNTLRMLPAELLVAWDRDVASFITATPDEAEVTLLIGSRYRQIPEALTYQVVWYRWARVQPTTNHDVKINEDWKRSVQWNETLERWEPLRTFTSEQDLTIVEYLGLSAP